MVIGRKELVFYIFYFLPYFITSLVSSAIFIFWRAISRILFILDIVVTRKLVNIPAMNVRELFTSQLRK